MYSIVRKSIIEDQPALKGEWVTEIDNTDRPVEPRYLSVKIGAAKLLSEQFCNRRRHIPRDRIFEHEGLAMSNLITSALNHRGQRVHVRAKVILIQTPGHEFSDMYLRNHHPISTPPLESMKMPQ
jgi:hypothetical protein